MPARPYSTREADEADQMIRVGESIRDVEGLPAPIAAACAHVLYAAAAELRNGRPLAIEVRRAARHLLAAVTTVQGRTEASGV